MQQERLGIRKPLLVGLETVILYDEARHDVIVFYSNEPCPRVATPSNHPALCPALAPGPLLRHSSVWAGDGR